MLTINNQRDSDNILSGDFDRSNIFKFRDYLQWIGEEIEGLELTGLV